jgi:hypothetical protein
LPTQRHARSLFRGPARATVSTTQPLAGAGTCACDA